MKAYRAGRAHFDAYIAGWLTTEVVHDFGNNDTKAKASVKQVRMNDR